MFFFISGHSNKLVSPHIAAAVAAANSHKSAFVPTSHQVKT